MPEIYFITFGGPSKNYHNTVNRICNEAKKWHIENKSYRRININFTSEPLEYFSIEAGWDPYYFSNDPDFLFNAKKPIA